MEKPEHESNHTPGKNPTVDALLDATRAKTREASFNARTRSATELFTDGQIDLETHERQVDYTQTQAFIAGRDARKASRRAEREFKGSPVQRLGHFVRRHM